jgi:hypothetical protein
MHRVAASQRTVHWLRQIQRVQVNVHPITWRTQACHCHSPSVSGWLQSHVLDVTQNVVILFRRELLDLHVYCIARPDPTHIFFRDL